MESVVSCIAYRNGQRLGEIEVEHISDVVKQENTFVWLGLREPPDKVMHKIQEEFGLHELAMEDAFSAHQRPKLEEYGSSLFIVLKTAQWWEGRMELGETHIFVGANYLITLRHGPSRPYTQVRSRCEGTPERLAKGPGYALYTIMDFVVDNFMPVVDAFQKRFERLEADIFHDRFDRKMIEQVYELRQELLDLRNAAAPVIDICSELVRSHHDLVHKELRAYYRDVLDHCTRVVEATDTLRAMANDAMQVNLAMMTIRQNEVVKTLAGWGAILAIPTMVFSMYGMNFQFMPELKWDFGYPVALTSTGLGCLWLYRRLKRTGWL